MFIGRSFEIKHLEEAYKAPNSRLVVIYGRRRIGKSSLVAKFAGRKKHSYSFEAIEQQNTTGQIAHLTEILKRQVKDPVLESIRFKNWQQVFIYLTDRIVKTNHSSQKTILFFDEIQWMAAGQKKLISIIKYFWDNEWKKHNLMLILCGSIASFMVRSVISSEALYGRINDEILLRGLLPNEISAFFGQGRSREEILRYMLVFGGVPKYYEEIDTTKSFAQNMNLLCFRKNAVMIREMERVFYSQFRESQVYKRIVSLLRDGIFTFQEIGQRLHIPSGGGLKLYCDNLENAEIIQSYVPFDKKPTSKFRKYTMSDEYIAFHFKYVEPNAKVIQGSSLPKLFERITSNSLEVFFGLAFERFCLKHALYLATVMGFGDAVLYAAPYFERADRGFQIDLLYTRSDKTITICEVKHRNREIGTEVIPEMERKCSLLHIPRGYSLDRALISLYGPDPSLKKSQYFNHYVTLDDLFGVEILPSQA